ncbi:MAG: hypothetical protein KatS3mg085_459 [Candidatus Dojkabacteria bacterium]|nr:MAG: hypothetical protein KatS3mg085_459 [Candidatus Dojkabacteria bacterium]
MSKVKSAKEILLDYDILKGDGNRHPKHEFQAYAYRLAHDLNDLVNLKIYMRLAKNVERTLLEQAYAYAIDSKTEEKAKIFLWKVKDLRKKLSQLKITSSFDYEIIIKQMTKLRNDLAEDIVKKNNKTFLAQDINHFRILLSEFFDNNTKKNNVLFVGLDCIELVSLFNHQNFRIFGIEYARNLTNLFKKHFKIKNFAKQKFITKDFLKNSYKNEQFDLVVLNSYWNFVPTGVEKIFFNELARISKSKILMSVKFAKETTQTWDKFVAKDTEYLYFQKTNSFDDFNSLLHVLNLQVIKNEQCNSKYLYLIEKKL